MEVVTTYVAFDDREFDDEQECLAYERALQELRGIIAFDEDRKIVSSVEELATSCPYCFITDAEEAKQTFSYIYEYYGTEIPRGFSDGDLLRYDDDKDDWVNIFNEFCKLGGLIHDLANEVLTRKDNSDKAVYQMKYRLMRCPNVSEMACGI